MKYYLLQDTDLISIHFLVVINVTNILLLFFFYFIFLYNHEVYQQHTTTIRQSNQPFLTYSFNFEDLYSFALSEEFPEEDEKCSICLENFDITVNSNVIKTAYCGHYFHEQCLVNWLRIRPKCPNCNNNLVARAIEEEN